jgi:hypothetical protein
MIWPAGSKVTDEVEDDDNIPEAEDDFIALAAGQHKPSAFGVTFSLDQTYDGSIICLLKFAHYAPASVESAGETGTKLKSWIRNPETVAFELDFKLGTVLDIDLFNLEDTGLCLKVYARIEHSQSTKVVSLNVYNCSEAPEGKVATDSELRIAFQTELEISLPQGEFFQEHINENLSEDLEQQSNSLLFRNKKTYATGSQCAAEWDETLSMVDSIKTTWNPTQVIPAFSSAGDEVFWELSRSGRLDAQWLSAASQKELIEALTDFIICYEKWIEQQLNKAADLPSNHTPAAQSNLSECKLAAARMRKGLTRLAGDEILVEAFKRANSAMALQHSWKKDSTMPLSWRPFQLGFILLSLESIAYKDAEDRKYFDLLWFPTGGGKTEAYLGLIAITAWLRFLRLGKGLSTGNVAIMRYTLRLLTSQQFQRAASLMLACEFDLRNSRHQTADQLDSVFSIGLWVGGAATPTRFEEVSSDSRAAESAKQLIACPCCHEKLSWKIDTIRQRIRPSCGNAKCELGLKVPIFGIATVDDDIYNCRPTLVIGTIDKFAQLPFQPQMKKLFDFRGENPTDLVIQDELHLISGPLGSIAGLYETAMDWLLSVDGARPKIIGSTATIRRATHQVRALFDRESFQFPPPGIDHENSGFAVVDQDKPGRLYVGITTAGRSAKFAIQAALGSIAQSAGKMSEHYGALADGYLTSLVYYNSLRELGGGVVQAQDDVPDSIGNYALRREESSRDVRAPLELTSRVSQQEIVETLDALEKPNGIGGSPDFVLATNMVSVGVDIPRLGLIVLQGTPKARSEYIQASSRVGRSDQSPGLVLGVFNASKARDRSSFESFVSWHRSIYAQVETTGVTPYAPRARDKALHATLVGMIRHGIDGMLDAPNASLITEANIIPILDFINQRVHAIAPNDLTATSEQLEDLLSEWVEKDPKFYKNPKDVGNSLLQTAESFAERIALGRFPESAWPTMNSMRSVEASTKFRLVERLGKNFAGRSEPDTPKRSTWRRPQK